MPTPAEQNPAPRPSFSPTRADRGERRKESRGHAARPAEPDLAQYRKRAKELVAVAASGAEGAVRAWVGSWLAGLVRPAGARLDDVVAAAALGRDDLVGRFAVDAATLSPDARPVRIPWMNVLPDAKGQIEVALVWAARSGGPSSRSCSTAAAQKL